MTIAENVVKMQHTTTLCVKKITRKEHSKWSIDVMWKNSNENVGPLLWAMDCTLSRQMEL